MPFSITGNFNEFIENSHRFIQSFKFSRIDGIFFDETGSPFCSACISPLDNNPVGLNLQFENKAHPSYAGGLFVYKCPKCNADYHIAGNTLERAKAKRAKPAN
jgi:hypothetical protein